jgi:glutaredoxin 3
MPKIEIYTRPDCGYCMRATMLLNSMELAYDEYDIYAEPGKKLELQSRVNYSTYPQIFIDDNAIGGFDDLVNLANQTSLPTT